MPQLQSPHGLTSRAEAWQRGVTLVVSRARGGGEFIESTKEGGVQRVSFETGRCTHDGDDSLRAAVHHMQDAQSGPPMEPGAVSAATRAAPENCAKTLP